MTDDGDVTQPFCAGVISNEAEHRPQVLLGMDLDSSLPALSLAVPWLPMWLLSLAYTCDELTGGGPHSRTYFWLTVVLPPAFVMIYFTVPHRMYVGHRAYKQGKEKELRLTVIIDRLDEQMGELPPDEADWSEDQIEEIKTIFRECNRLVKDHKVMQVATTESMQTIRGNYLRAETNAKERMARGLHQRTQAKLVREETQTQTSGKMQIRIIADAEVTQGDTLEMDVMLEVSAM